MAEGAGSGRRCVIRLRAATNSIPGQDSVCFAGACATPRRIFATGDAFLRQGESPRPPSGVLQRRIRDARVNNSGTARANSKTHATDGGGWGYVPFAPFSGASNPRWQARKWQNHPAANSSLAHHRNFLKGAMSKPLKARGFKFVGPTICYAFMQATGMVNDHIAGCFKRTAAPPPS